MERATQLKMLFPVALDMGQSEGYFAKFHNLNCITLLLPAASNGEKCYA